jgi:hypothetical protein
MKKIFENKLTKLKDKKNNINFFDTIMTDKKVILNILDNEIANYEEKIKLITFKIIKESHPTNYGHEDLIIMGDIIFPPRDPNHNQPNISNNQYGGQYYNSSNNIISSSENIFDKQTEINGKDVKPVKNQKDYFELYRYGIGELNKPNDDGVTFSIALFKPNSLLDATNGEGWMKRYFQNHLKQIILGNYFFPDSNYRTYLDYYMLAKFESFDGNDDRLKVTKYVDKFEHYDFEEYEYETINNLLINFYKEIKKYEDYQFENGLARILFYYDTACRSILNNGKYELRNKTGDFFVYKFKGPFLENIGKPNEGHITDGYIGQSLRYISTIQKSYTWNNINVNRPTHLVWRDAHANSLGYNDFKWISKLNSVCKNKKNKIFFLPSSLDYEAPWNDKALCKINNSEITRSAIAGIVQFTNFTDDENFIPFDIYKQSIGMIFLVDLKNELPLKNHRPKGGNDKRIEYAYGIDEYALSAMFNIDYFMKNSIFLNHHWSWRVLNLYEENNIYTHCEFLLLRYMVDNKIIEKSTKLSKFDIIRLIENLRSNYSLKDNKALSLILAIYPTKYFYNQTIFSLSVENQCELCYRKWDANLEKFKDVKGLLENSNIDKINSFENILSNVPTKLKQFGELTLENLTKLNINCRSTAINNALEWCTRPYIEKNSELLSCNPEKYLSGFYFDNHPSDDIGFLRCPEDLEHVINVLEKNKLKIKLNKSSYKLHEEKLNFKLATSCNINTETGEINYDILNKILNYKDVKKVLLNIDPKYYSQIIWRELNYAGYDVPPQYFANLPIDNLMLNQIGWIDHTIDILGTCFDIDHIKMDEYKQKYLKYKQKYLNLKLQR